MGADIARDDGPVQPPTHDLVARFRRDGVVRIDDAFSREVADAGRAVLWQATGCDPDDSATWRRPVVRLGDRSDAPFVAAANAPPLCAAFDALVGLGRWMPRGSLGTFVVRFPSDDDPGDTGWHVDASFGGDDSDPHDYLTWRINAASHGRALLILFLFSDVDPDDAPTRLRVGSHHEVARILAPAGAAGMSVRELAPLAEDATAGHPEALATGPAGTVYLCHPFLVHAGQPNRIGRPRFLAQPPLMWAPGSSVSAS